MLSNAQIRMRHSGLTATDMARISGENPFSGPIQVYDEKTSPVELLLERSSVPSNEAMSGQIFEAALVKRYVAERTPSGHRLRILQTRRTHRHPELHWAMATPDRFVFAECLQLPPDKRLTRKAMNAAVAARRGPYLLECKLVGSRMAKSWDTTSADVLDADRVPSYVYVQCQWQMFVLGHARCDVASLIGGTRFHSFTLVRDEVFIRDLVKLGQAFWDRIKLREPPQPDGSQYYDRWLERRFPARARPLTKAPDGAEELARLYKEASKQVAAARAEQKRYGQALKNLIADCQGIASETFEAEWTTSRGEIDTAALAKATLMSPVRIETFRKRPRRSLRVWLADTGDVGDEKEEEMF